MERSTVGAAIAVGKNHKVLLMMMMMTMMMITANAFTTSATATTCELARKRMEGLETEKDCHKAAQTCSRR